MINWHTFYGGGKQLTWELALRDQFQADNPQITVNHIPISLYDDPVPLGFLEGILGGDPPSDVVSGFVGGANLQARARAGQLRDLTPIWRELDLERYNPPAIVDLASVDGKKYFVPHAVQWNPIWYRADIFAEHGLTPPETWDELLGLCANLRDLGITPFAVAANTWTPPLARWFTILNLRLNGPKFHGDLMAGAVKFTDVRVRSVFRKWLDLFQADCFERVQISVSYREALTRFADGRAAMYNLGEWIFENLSVDSAASIDFFRFPVLDPDVPVGEIASVYGSYLPSGATDPEGAEAFLRHLIDVRIQSSVVEEVGRLVPDRRIDQDLLPPYQLKGMRFLEETSMLTQLLEFNLFSEGLARESLRVFVEFYKQRSDESIDSLLEDLEAARQRAPQ